MNRPSSPPRDDRIAVSLQEASRLTGLSTASLRRRAGEGVIRTVRIGRRRLVVRADLEKLFVESGCGPDQ